MNDIIVNISNCKVKIENLTDRTDEDGNLFFDFDIKVIDGDKTESEITGDVVGFMNDIISYWIQTDVF